MTRSTRRQCRSARGAAFGALLALTWCGAAGAADEQDFWPALQKDIFGARTVTENTAVVTLEAPYRAEDAALVPLTVRIPAGVAERARELTLLIDNNPAPVV